MNFKDFHKLSATEIAEISESLSDLSKALILEAKRRSDQVWITRTGTLYHSAYVCKGLNSASSIIRVTRSWAAGDYGLLPCDDCA